jgi:methyl-accepting chemotaxis protein
MDLLQRLSIKARLQINAGIIAVAMLILLFVLLSEISNMSQLNKTIQTTEELSILQLEMRKYEKNFLAYKQEDDLAQFATQSQKMQIKIVLLEQLFDNIGFDKSQVKQLKNLVNVYETKFENVVNLQKEIGLHPKDALYGQLRTAVHEVETVLKGQKNYQLLSSMLQLRRDEKDFMLRLDEKYLQKFDETIASFSEAVNQSDLPSSEKSALLTQLKQYQQKFSALVNAQKKLGLTLKSAALGELAISATENDQFIQLLVKETEEQIIQSQAQVKIISFTIFGVAISIVMFLVYLTSRSIIAPINKVCGVIKEIRGQNNLTLSVRSQGMDEVSALTQDFDSLINDFKNLIFEVNSALSNLGIATDARAAP